MFLIVNSYISTVKPEQEGHFNNICDKITDWWHTPSLKDPRIKGAMLGGGITMGFGALCVYKGATIGSDKASLAMTGLVAMSLGFFTLTAPQEVVKQVNYLLSGIKLLFSDLKNELKSCPYLYE